MDVYSEIFSYIESHRSRLCQLVRKLVEERSENPPGDTVEAAEAYASQLSKLRFKVETVRAEGRKVNLVAEWNCGRKETILFNGHLDTVPVGKADGWIVDPFSGSVRGDWLYGRGSADDKGGLGCLTIAFEALRSLGVQPKYNIAVHGVCDEEVGGRLGTLHLIQKGHVKANYGVVVEGSVSRNRVFVRNAMKGIMKVQLTTFGKAAHAGNPKIGVNANLKMAKLLTALERVRFTYKPSRYLTPPTIAVGTILQGGDKSNVIPKQCTSTSDIRYLPGMGRISVQRDIMKVIRKIRRGDRDLKASVKVLVSDHKPAQLREDEPIVRLAAEAIRRVVGYSPRIMGGYGATDASHLIHQARLPTLVGLGPGDLELGQLHGVNERVSIKALVDLAKIYVSLVC